MTEIQLLLEKNAIARLPLELFSVISLTVLNLSKYPREDHVVACWTDFSVTNREQYAARDTATDRSTHSSPGT